ncbi:universal stress protein [Antarctobacter jejuensis]|uniref:universal stress protein n=1 Tax=Antarctobacter jejuensis TaxID=1439938 RepID=UPI003FD1E3A8
MYKNILIPVAFEEGSAAKARAATDVAQKLSEEGAAITFLHVMEEVPGYVSSYLPADYTAQARKSVENELAAMAADVPGARSIVVSGHSGRTILDWAADNGADLIVISSHRPGMQDLLLGSTAAKVVRHAQCAVHVMR